MCYEKFANSAWHFLYINPHDIYNDLARLKRQFHLLLMVQFGQYSRILGVSALLPNQLGNINMEREDNMENHYRETKDKVAVNELKILLLDIILPLIDILVDIAKALVLIFEDQQIQNYQGFSDHFLHTAIYGVISVLLKWCPAVVAALHFQDMNRCWSIQGIQIKSFTPFQWIKCYSFIATSSIFQKRKKGFSIA